MEDTLNERVIGTLIIAAHVVRRTFDFRGRSRRTEFLCYVAAAMLVKILVFVLGELALVSWQTRGVQVVLDALLTLPMFALIARRFHDIGFTGWLVLPIFATVAINVHEDFWFAFASLEARIEGYPYDGPIGALAVPGVIIMFWALIQGGQVGEENRYGPDPRLHSREPKGDPATS